MPWWGWHACPLAPRNWCLGGFNTPFCLKKSLGNSWTSSFLSLKCWRTSGKWLKWTCTYCGLGMFTSFFSHMFDALQPSILCTEASNWPGRHKSRSHHLFGEWLWHHHSEAGEPSISIGNRGHIYAHTDSIYIYVCIYIYVYICVYIYTDYIPYSKQRKNRNLKIWCKYHLHTSTPSWKHVCIFFYIATFCSAKLLEKAMERWYVQWQCASTCVTFDIIWCGSFGSLCLIHVRGLVLNPCEVFLQLFRGGFAKPPKRPGVSQASLLGEVRAGISAIVARRGQEMAVWTVWVKQNRDLIIKNMGFNMI